MKKKSIGWAVLSLPQLKVPFTAEEELVFLTDNLLWSSSASSPLPSAPPSSAMDLCWTSTSANAGGDSTIRAEWPSTDTKVGYKSLCAITKKIKHFFWKQLVRWELLIFGRGSAFSWQPHILFEIPLFKWVFRGLEGYKTSVEGLRLFSFREHFAGSVVRCDGNCRWPPSRRPAEFKRSELERRERYITSINRITSSSSA